VRKILISVSLAVLALTIHLALSWTHVSSAAARASAFNDVEPWSTTQTVTPDALTKELSNADAGKKPFVACVGFRALYEGAHIPSSSFHGAGSTSQGIANLKKWAQNMPRSANLVLYCGCCPLEHCPNLRPAFVALREMGFTNLRVLLLPKDFNTDWIEKGYQIEKGH